MTTVAFDGRTLAADGRISDGDTIYATAFDKIFRCRGSLVGMSGDVDCIHRTRRWFVDGCRGVRPKGSISIIVVQPSGRALAADDNSEFSPVLVPYAIGSGAAYAIGAMLAGKGATQAVKIAATRDLATGGRIKRLSIRQSANKRKR